MTSPASGTSSVADTLSVATAGKISLVMPMQWTEAIKHGSIAGPRQLNPIACNTKLVCVRRYSTLMPTHSHCMQHDIGMCEEVQHTQLCQSQVQKQAVCRQAVDLQHTTPKLLFKA